MASNHPPPSSSSQSQSPTTSVSKLRKMPPIPARRSTDNEGGADDDNKEDIGDRASPPYTRSSSLSPLRFSSSVEAEVASFLKDRDDGIKQSGGGRKETKFAGIKPYPNSPGPGKRTLRTQSKSLGPRSLLNPCLEGHHAAFAKEIQSPRFQAILRLTSGQKKRAPDVKSFSHELNSKGVKSKQKVLEH